MTWTPEQTDKVHAAQDHLTAEGSTYRLAAVAAFVRPLLEEVEQLQARIKELEERLKEQRHDLDT